MAQDASWRTPCQGLCPTKGHEDGLAGGSERSACPTLAPVGQALPPANRFSNNGVFMTFGGTLIGTLTRRSRNQKGTGSLTVAVR